MEKPKVEDASTDYSLPVEQESHVLEPATSSSEDVPVPGQSASPTETPASPGSDAVQSALEVPRLEGVAKVDVTDCSHKPDSAGAAPSTMPSDKLTPSLRPRRSITKQDSTDSVTSSKEPTAQQSESKVSSRFLSVFGSAIVHFFTKAASVNDLHSQER